MNKSMNVIEGSLLFLVGLVVASAAVTLPLIH
jgi:hypothetical protein